MKRFFYGFIAFLFLFLNIFPLSSVFADEIVVTGTPAPIQGDITDDDLTDILAAGITADLVSQGYEIDLSASDGDWDNFKNSILGYIFDQAASGSGFIGEIYNSALYHNLLNEDFTLWYPDTTGDNQSLPGISKRSIYRNLSDGFIENAISDSRSDDTPIPQPDINYAYYLNLLNTTGYENWSNLGQPIITGNYFNGYPIYNHDWNDISLVYIQSQGSTYYINTSSDETLIGQTSFINNSNNKMFASNILTCYIAQTGSSWSCEITTDSINMFGAWGYEPLLYTNMTDQYLTNWNSVSRLRNGHYENIPDMTKILTSNSLEDLFRMLCGTVRHVNVYVNGTPWAIVGQQTLPTITITPGFILQGTNYPLVYNFPEPPYFDYNRMIDIIKHALLQYGVIQWEDIADVFVDVNGQTAVAVLEIHRNDYDVLYDEQYPGIPLPNRFNTHLLDSSHQYLSPVVQTVEETTGVLPGEIKGALAIGMMLTIFACLIHRLLE